MMDPYLKELLKLPTKAKSCEACRRSKVKCQAAPGGQAFPCARCVRLKLPCQDPQSSELDQHPGRLENVVNLIRKRLHADPPVNRRSAERLMAFFSLLYRRRVLGGRTTPTSPMGMLTRDMLRTLASYLSKDPDTYLSELTRLDGPGGVTVDGFYMTLEAPRGQALHPYCAALLAESPSSTIAMVNVEGEETFLTNDCFARTFFSETEALRLYNQENIPSPAIISMPIHPDDKVRYYRTVRRVMLESQLTCSEENQIYRVRLRKLGVTVMVLMKSRFVLTECGSYLAAAHSLIPLPMNVAPSTKKSSVVNEHRRLPIYFPPDADPWTEVAKVFGEWDDEPSSRAIKFDDASSSSSNGSGSNTPAPSPTPASFPGVPFADQPFPPTQLPQPGAPYGPTDCGCGCGGKRLATMARRAAQSQVAASLVVTRGSKGGMTAVGRSVEAGEMMATEDDMMEGEGEDEVTTVWRRPVKRTMWTTGGQPLPTPQGAASSSSSSSGEEDDDMPVVPPLLAGDVDVGLQDDDLQLLHEILWEPHSHQNPAAASMAVVEQKESTPQASSSGGGGRTRGSKRPVSC